jgi:hypothetical protein
MSIAKIFVDVSTFLEQYLASHGQAPVEQKLGASHIADAGNYNRIVWALVGGPVVPPKHAGDDRTARGRRTFARRREMVDVHIWGPKADTDEEMFEGTELLMGYFAAAARETQTSMSFRCVETDWTIGQTQSTASGALVVLKIEINLPFLFTPKVLVKGSSIRVGVTPEILPQPS